MEERRELKRQLIENHRIEYEEFFNRSIQLKLPSNKKDAIVILNENLTRDTPLPDNCLYFDVLQLKLRMVSCEEHFRIKGFKYYNLLYNNFPGEDIKVWMPGEYIYCEGLETKKLYAIHTPDFPRFDRYGLGTTHA